MVAVERRIQAEPISRFELSSKILDLSHDISASLIQNPNFAQQAAYNFFSGFSKTVSWKNQGVLYHARRQVKKNRFGKERSETLTLTTDRSGGQDDGSTGDSVKITRKFKGKEKGFHIETIVEKEAVYTDSELAILKARLVLRDLFVSPNSSA